jgi:hypothetical protein
MAGFDFGRPTPVDLQKERLQISRAETLDKYINQFRDTCFPQYAVEDRIAHSDYPFLWRALDTYYQLSYVL